MLQERHLTKGTFEIKSRVVFNCNIIAYRYSKIRQKKKPHHYFWLGLRKANSQLVKTNTKKKNCLGLKGRNRCFNASEGYFDTRYTNRHKILRIVPGTQ